MGNCYGRLLYCNTLAKQTFQPLFSVKTFPTKISPHEILVSRRMSSSNYLHCQILPLRNIYFIRFHVQILAVQKKMLNFFFFRCSVIVKLVENFLWRICLFFTMLEWSLKTLFHVAFAFDLGLLFAFFSPMLEWSMRDLTS